MNATLDWSLVGCASTYDVRICNDSACSSVVASSNVPVSQWQVSPVLNPNKYYWWQVRAKNSYGDGSWSVASKFFTSSDMVLSNGTPVNASITGGNVPGGILLVSIWNYYYVDIPAGATTFFVYLYNLSQHADLYTRMSSKPTSSGYTCKSPHIGYTTQDQECMARSPSSGRWWIGINSISTGTTTYTVKAIWSIPACASVSLSPGSDGFAATSALGVVTVTPSSSSCSWTAVSNDSWITITPGSSGSGTGTVSYSVAANSGPARTGTITIGGQTFTITQQASANTYFDAVQKIYIGYYQRPADPAGLIYWANDFLKYSLTDLIKPFASAPESQKLYGTIDNNNIESVINQIYNSLFGRDAEPDGLKYWADEFRAGVHTPATIMLNILFGARYADLQAINNKVIAANLFTRTIDPDLDGSNFQATGYPDERNILAARNFLTWYATSVKVPTQAETTLFIKNNIANPGDPILGQ